MTSAGIRPKNTHAKPGRRMTNRSARLRRIANPKKANIRGPGLVLAFEVSMSPATASDALLSEERCAAPPRIAPFENLNTALFLRRAHGPSGLQHPHPPEGGVRAPPRPPREHVRLRPHAVRPLAPGSREDVRGVRRHRAIPPTQGLLRVLRAEHHGHRRPHHRRDEG